MGCLTGKNSLTQVLSVPYWEALSDTGLECGYMTYIV